MNNTPDSWEEDWSSTSPAPRPESSTAASKVSGKVTKAQKRAQQAEFNRQIWDQAEKPQETNYFLESRNIVPLRSEFKPPPILLSRKGPVIASRKPLTDGLNNLNLKEESSEDEDASEKKLSLLEQQELSAKLREEKQRKYEERRQELFGNVTSVSARPKSNSGNTSPSSGLTPPSSRSATPNRARGGRGGGGRRGGLNQHQSKPQRELFDPTYTPKPDSAYVQRQNGVPKAPDADLQPIRAPKGPDGSGRGGFGFAPRGGSSASPTHKVDASVETT